MTMPTTLTHGFVGVALGGTFFRKMPRRFWYLAVACTTVQDLDVIGLRPDVGIPYGHLLGHRGLSHSLPFAFVISVIAVSLMLKYVKLLSLKWWCLWAFFFAIAASQGLLDAMTHGGGLGVALLSPFDRTRYFLPWRPILVSPIGLHGLFSKWGLRVIICEVGLIWIPLGALLAGRRLGTWLRRRRADRQNGDA